MTPDQVRRYARHVLLPDVGGVGQRRLLDAAVRVDDASLPGATAIAYLAAAGIGTIIVVDEGLVSEDDVGLLYESDDVGRPRREAVRERVAALNPDVRVVVSGATAHVLPILGADDPVGALEHGAAAAAELIREIVLGENG